MIQPFTMGATISRDLLDEDPYGILAPPPPSRPGFWGRMACRLLGHHPWVPALTEIRTFIDADLVLWDRKCCLRCGKSLADSPQEPR